MSYHFNSKIAIQCWIVWFCLTECETKPNTLSLSNNAWIIKSSSELYLFVMLTSYDAFLLHVIYVMWGIKHCILLNSNWCQHELSRDLDCECFFYKRNMPNYCLFAFKAYPLNKLKLIHSNLEDDPEDVRMEFMKYLRSIITFINESREREEMSIIS